MAFGLEDEMGWDRVILLLVMFRLDFGEDSSLEFKGQARPSLTLLSSLFPHPLTLPTTTQSRSLHVTVQSRSLPARSLRLAPPRRFLLL